MAWIIGIFFFGLLIAFHEFGHMWAARRMGMRVERFSIGFGPSVLSWRRGETEYVLGALPLGGYVKVAGMSPEDEIEDDDQTSYANKPAWRRLVVIAAGPLANFLLAFLIGVPLLMFANAVVMNEPRVGTVQQGSAAADAGLREGDLIVSIDGRQVSTFSALPGVLREQAEARPSEALELVVERDGERLTLSALPRGNPPALGIGPATRTIPGLAFPQAVIQSAREVVDQNVRTAQVLVGIVTRTNKEARVGGPIAILSHTAEQAERGLQPLMRTVAAISIAIGFFNMLPLPGLDGGRLMFLGYEIVARRRVNQQVEGWIHGIGVLALLLLIVVVSYGDIMKRFGKG